MKEKHGYIKNNELIFTPPNTPGSKRIEWAPRPTFDEEAEMIVHSHYDEGEEVITVHAKVVPAPVSDDEQPF